MLARSLKAGLRGVDLREDGGQFVQTLWRPKRDGVAHIDRPSQQNRSGDGKSKAHNEAHDALSWSEQRIMETCLASPRTAPELLMVLGYVARTEDFKRGLESLIAMSLLEMSMPGKPRSKSQKYRLTDKGRAWLASAKP